MEQPLMVVKDTSGKNKLLLINIKLKKLRKESQHFLLKNL